MSSLGSCLVRLSKPSATIWVIEVRNGVDNRLSGDVLRELSRLLNLVEEEWRSQWGAASKLTNIEEIKTGASGALVITGNIDQEKFFSNGFVWEEVVATPGFIYNESHPLLIKLLSFPIPTIAAMIGHTFAAGFLLAMACDYRVMTSGKAWASMNEIDFGAPWPHGVASILRSKISNAPLRRRVVEGYRFTSEDCMNFGLVDRIVGGGSKAVLQASIRMAENLSKLASMGAYGLTKKALYVTTLNDLRDSDIRVMTADEDWQVRSRL